MKSMQGILHKTSLQAAQERQTTYLSAPVAGQKRSWSEPDSDPKTPHLNPPALSAQGVVGFQRAISLPTAPVRLSASTITNLESCDGPSEYSQRRVFAATPTATRDPELSLAHPTYGLPVQLVENFASQGIKQIYPWQKNCLKGPGLLSGDKNLIYCAPTGGGKSLVADCR